MLKQLGEDVPYVILIFVHIANRACQKSENKIMPQ